MGSLNRKYPHLHPDDAQIWHRFITANPHAFHKLEYDVNVGSGRDPGPHYDKTIRKMAAGLSQRRIDVIGHLADKIICIEITPSLGWRAIGQCLGYPIIYKLSHNPQLPVSSLIICETIQTDLAPCCHALTLPIIEIGPADSKLGVHAWNPPIHDIKPPWQSP